MAEKKSDRRNFLKSTAVVSAVAAAGLSLEDKILLAQAPSKAKPATAAKSAPKAATAPMGKIGNVKISRLICGGNLISGFAHSRNLVYVSELMKKYFTDDKVMETWEACEQAGINTMVSIINDHTLRLIKRHRKNGGKLQWLAQMHSKTDKPLEMCKLAVDNGAVGAFIQGMYADKMVRDKSGKGIDALHKSVAFLKQNKLIAGVGGHTLESPKVCEKEKVDLDFYFKTFNAESFNAGSPEETLKFMSKITKPWIAFKVLAAGSINPTKGFKHALQSGADFMCVGMFDFQIKHDAQIVKGIFARGVKRDRPWRG